MWRLLLHPAILLVIAGLIFWFWARRVNLRVRLSRLPTSREWALMTLFLRILRRLFRL